MRKEWLNKPNSLSKGLLLWRRCRQFRSCMTFLIPTSSPSCTRTVSTLVPFQHSYRFNTRRTGSQLPLLQAYSDARQNLVLSLLFAAHVDVPEVCILFNNVLLRGCRAKKVDATSTTAFLSPNFPPLATIGTKPPLLLLHLNIHMCVRACVRACGHVDTCVMRACVRA